MQVMAIPHKPSLTNILPRVSILYLFSLLECFCVEDGIHYLALVLSYKFIIIIEREP